MSHDPSVARRQVEITNEYGLHLGPAAKFVKLAGQFQSEIRVHHNGKEINGKSILDLTLLAAESGTRLDLEAHGPDAAAAIDALARLWSWPQFREGEGGPGRTEGSPWSPPEAGHARPAPAATARDEATDPPTRAGRRRPTGARAAPGPNPKRCNPCVGSAVSPGRRDRPERWSSTRTGRGSPAAISPPECGRRRTGTARPRVWSRPAARAEAAESEARRAARSPAVRRHPRGAARPDDRPTRRPARYGEARVEQGADLAESMPSARCSTATPPGSNGTSDSAISLARAPPMSATSASGSSAI